MNKFFSSKAKRFVAAMGLFVMGAMGLSANAQTVDPAPYSYETEGPVLAALPETIRVYWNSPLLLKVPTGGVEMQDWATWGPSQYPDYKVVDDGDNSYLEIDCSTIEMPAPPYAGVFNFAVQAGTVYVSNELDYNKYVGDGAMMYFVNTYASNEALTSVPAKGSYNFDLETLTLSWPGYAVKPSQAQPDMYSFRFGMDGSMKTEAESVVGVGTDNVPYGYYNSVEITLDKEYTYADGVGYYVLMVDQGALTLVNLETNEVTVNEDLEVYYYLSNFVAEPQNGTGGLTSLDKVAIYMQDIKLKAEDASGVSLQVVANGTTSTLTDYDYSFEPITEGEDIVGYILNIDPAYVPYNAKEELKVNIPAATFTYGETNSPAINLNYYMVGSMPAPVATPQAGEVLSGVYVSWNSYLTLTGKGQVLMTTPAGQEVDVTENISVVNYLSDGTIGTPTDENATLYQLLYIDLSATPYNTKGGYTFSIPAGFVNADDYDTLNEAYTFNYNVVTFAAAPSVNPPVGNYPVDFYQLYISWPNLTVAQGPNWDEKALKVTVSGGSAQGEANAYVVTANEDLVEAGQSGAMLKVMLPDMSATNWGDPYSFTLTVPQGMVYVNDKDGKLVYSINNELNLTYNIKNIYADYTTVPRKGSNLASLETVTISWDGTPSDAVLGVNAACTAKVTYGTSAATAKEVKSATIVDGSLVVDLGEEYTTQGAVKIFVPDYYLTATVNGETTNLLSEEFTYNISEYVVVPQNASEIYDAVLDQVTVYSTDGSIGLEGDYKNITLVNQSTGEVIGYCEAVEFVDEMFDEATWTNLPLHGVIIKFDTPYDLPNGTAVVNIPAGMFTFNGELYNDVITLEYYVHPPVPEATVVPENGSKVRKLSTITIDWNNSPLGKGYYNYIANPKEDEYSDAPIALYKDGKEIVKSINNLISIVNETAENGQGVEYVASSKVVVDFSAAPYTEAGVYTLTIPEGYVDVEAYGMDNAPKYNNELALQFTVDPSIVTYMEEGNYEIMGQGVGPNIASAGNLLVWWDFQPIAAVSGKFITLTVNGNDTYEITPIIIDGVDHGPGEPSFEPMPTAATQDDNAAVFLLPESLTELMTLGTYVYNIPAGVVVNNDGDVNPAQVITFNILPTTAIEPTVYPVAPINGDPTQVDDLSVVTISWDDLELEMVGSEYRFDVNDNQNILGDEITVADGTVLTLDVADYVDGDGSYQVVIPAGSILITEDAGETFNQEVVLLYVIGDLTGVNAFEAEDGVYRVYNLNGINVLTTTNAADLNNLDAGLYIINGKKVLYRK